ncbi:hypothetical protein ACFO4E_02005 [Nocardiopsis mangrovi]|uniref:Uncharacterized protein n=1 Tax=Nocardiopsis mangrovi TaxID=1179818 RepID=A0ABV9DSN9_9ACTN
MKRTSIRRLAFVSIAAPALVIGGPALAMADSIFVSETEAAGPHGAASHQVIAKAIEEGHHREDKNGKGEEHGKEDHGKKGGVFFHEQSDAAGKHGAVSSSTTSKAN